MVGQAGSGITQTQGDARYARQSENLSDLDNAETARTNLGLGDAAEEDVGLGSGNVPQLDSNGDLNVGVIPSSIARLASPAFTGNPTAPTQSAGNDSTRVATTEFVQDEIPALSDADPEDVGETAAEGTSGDTSRRDHQHRLPINNTMEFVSNEFGVNTQRVIQEVSEWVQHFATGSAHDTSGHTGKYHEYTSSNTVRRIGSVQYDFTPANSNGDKTYRVYIIELTGRNVDAVLGVSETYNGNFLQHRFHFTDGVTINPAVRIGIGLHRTDGGGNNYNLSVRAGAESQDSPRESYDDASDDFQFLGRFNHDRNLPTVGDTVGGTTAGEIYGNPEIFYQIIHTHESLVGDGTVGPEHISSGSAALDAVLKADGSGGATFGAVVVHGNNIVDNTIPTPKYGNDTVTKGKLAADAKITANPSGTDGDRLTRLDVGGTNWNVRSQGSTHIQSGGTSFDSTDHTIEVAITGGSVEGGDDVLFTVPTGIGNEHHAGGPS